MSPFSLRSLAPSLALAATFLAVPAFAVDRRPTETDKTFGAPPARQFEEVYDGPPVVGEFVTLLPEPRPAPARQSPHDVRIDILAREIEIAPGVRYAAWTFGGSVPGPVLHVREGDRVVFTMKNRSDELGRHPDALGGLALPRAARGREPAARDRRSPPPMPHGIDFHAGTVAPNDKWRPIAPGQSIRLEWTANYPGDLPLPLLAAAGAPPHGDGAVRRGGRLAARRLPHRRRDRSRVRDRPVGVLPGGERNRRLRSRLPRRDGEQPLARALQRPRALDDRPPAGRGAGRARCGSTSITPGRPEPRASTSSAPSSTPCTTRATRRTRWRGMQTVLLGASNGAVVELVVPEEGTYPFVDHEFADATLGAVGLLRAGTPPKEANAGNH